MIVLVLIRSALFALLFYGLTLALVLLAFLTWPLGPGAVATIGVIWAKVQRLLMRWIVGQRVMIEGEIPADAHFIVSKHESMFETIDSFCFMHRPMIAAKKELGAIPLWGVVARRYGLILIDRSAGASALRQVRAAARQAQASGRAILLYPEGTRVPHGAAPPLRAGFAGIYSVLASPVVPIAIDSGRLLGKNGFLRWPGTIHYVIGAPVPPGLPRAEAEARVHAAINTLNLRNAREEATPDSP